MYEKVFATLSTSFAEFPEVTLDSSLGRARVRMRFPSSQVVSGSFTLAIVTFEDVVDFHYFDGEIGFPLVNAEDFEFSLIECLDSRILHEFLTSESLANTASPIVVNDQLRHLRISFDDHGSYDIICLSVSLQTERSAEQAM